MLRKDSPAGFISRFVLLHVVTYLVFGVLFMLISDYFTYFQESVLLRQIMRSSDSLIVRFAVLIQIGRGLLLALAVVSFREVFLGSRGWLRLFFLMWVFTAVGAVITGPGSIEGIVYTKIGLANPLIGYPEVILQMLVFSFFLIKWEKRIQGV